nr:DUF2867 domain-containing protein [uncultured Duganella sp.]
MPSTISAVQVPPQSVIHQRLTGAYFYDCYAQEIAANGASALELYLKVVATTPAWVNSLMALRNRLVRLVGLKNLGHLGDFDKNKPASQYRLGDRVGIFSIVYLSDDEIILGDSDKHLNVEVSVCKMRGADHDTIAVSTVVHTHNALGRLYMLFVAPLHKLIVPASMRQAGLA